MDSGTQETAWKATEVMKVKAEEMAGISAPLGFWDPLRLSTIFKDNTGLLYFREAELKHGRVSMLAFLGIFVGEKYHPFFGGNIDLPAYQVRSMFLETEVSSFWLAALVGIGALEVASVRTQYDKAFWEFDETGTSDFMSSQLSPQDKLPGDFGFDPLKLKPQNPKGLKEMQTKEINNGRLAMLAVMGILGQELATGQKIF